MSYHSVLENKNIDVRFDFYDRLLPEAQDVLARAAVGPMQVMTCGLDHTVRAKRFTGTDLPKMFGFIDEKYGDLRTVLAEKMGILKPDFTDSTTTRVGKYMEPYLASQAICQFHEQIEAWGLMGPVFLTLGENHQHDTLNLACSTDLCIYQEDDLRVIAEFKHTRADWETPPDKVIVQVQAQMMCAKQSGMTIFGLTGGNTEDKVWPMSLAPDWVKKIDAMVTEAEEIRVSGIMPAVLKIAKPEATKKRPVAQVVPSWTRLANAMVQKRNEMDKLKADIDKMNAILNRHFQLGASLSMDTFSATKSLAVYEPSLNEKRALEQILSQIVPDLSKDMQAKVEQIKSACMKNGYSSERFVIKRKGER